MKILLLFLMLNFTAQIFAQGQTKCFRNEGLKDNHIVRFEADGGDVAGSYFVETDDDPEKTQTFDFSGTRSGNALTVQFAGEIPLGIAPSKTENLIWTLSKSAGREVLQIKFYGKNYETNKYANYTAEFVLCKPDYTASAKQAKRISFAKGAKSTTFNLLFKNQTENKAFLLRARKGQTISVVTPGCGISVYYPDKTKDKEGGIDTFSVENARQTGDYLFIIRPAGEPGKCATTFEITN